MNKWTTIATSLLLAGGAAIGVAGATDNGKVSVDEAAVVLNTQTAQPTQTENENRPANDETISKEEAIAIAQQVLPGKVKEIERDSDDGHRYYEIELKYEGKDYDFDIDAATGEVLNIDGNLLRTPLAEEMEITAEQAKQAVLDEVGEGRIKEIELEKNRGTYMYEIEVKVHGDDDDWYVDANTGEVLASGHHKRGAEAQSQRTQQADSAERLSVEEAKNIALAHVGQGRVDDADLDRENGRLVYEIEIEQSGGDDVELIIDALTGEILHVDWD
ncbi:PepSY domain-containing protein [Alkalihalobacillus oceani]|uniref:PepSY domain-containing protein n=1 Tax=Halalkalibacter oceani TaxID=1653776 RepID=UPI00203EB5FE|nr:PepSY domain-containing protein [Halalkalibacter oceani]MCM3762826.1 PepSY domain-containing protein [Halalkalibacter oceani]